MDATIGGASQAQQAPSPEAADFQVIVGDIPAEPSCFQARESLAGQLDRASTRVSVVRPAPELNGLGATQLAAAYARAKLAAGWRLVAWVNGADTGSLLTGLTAVADGAGLTDGHSGRGMADVGAVVRHWLESDGDQCLLVFDDVSDPEVVRRFVPVGGTARVLIVSNRPAAASLGSVVPVDVFSAGEAATFLVGRTGWDDEAGAAAVAAALGHLPLALALAAAVMAGQQRGGYAWYLGRLQAVSADISLAGDEGQPYPLDVVRTVLLSLQAVRAADRTGISTRVMEIMAGLSPAGVHRELLYSAGRAGVLASGGHLAAADLVDRVLEWLGGRSLLTFSLDGKTVVMNRLVARVIRNGLARRGRLTAAYEAAAFVLDVHARALVGSPDDRAIRGILQQVASLLDSLAEPAVEINEELAWVLLRLRFVAFYHSLELGDSTPQAIAIGEPLVRDFERLLGPDHPDTLNSRNSLAAAYLAAGRVAEAIPLFEQILAARQRVLGPDDPETLISQNNLASAYQDAGRVAEAIHLYELNLGIRERLLGPDHPGTLNSRANLAAAYRSGGRDAEAIPLLEETLAGRERALGPDHPDTQATRKNLATAYQDAGRAGEAVPLLERNPADRSRMPRSGHAGAQTSRRNRAGADRVDRSADTVPVTEQAPLTKTGQASGGNAGPLPPAGIRRPPAAPARRGLPAGFRRPPAGSAGRPLPSGVTRPPVKPAGRSSGGRAPERPREDAQHDREAIVAIAAGDPAGMAMAFDRYAAAVYDYSRWILRDSAAAADALKDTFAVAAATFGDLAESPRLRPWLFALARNECRRRIRPGAAARDDAADAANESADAADELSDADGELSDATVRFRAVGAPGPGDGELSDATVRFRAVGAPGPGDGELSDATVRFRMISQPVDPVTPILMISQPVYDPRHIRGDQGQAEIRSLIHSILSGLKLREREIIELSYRHELYDADLAIALAVPQRRADEMAARARARLEEALGALHIALTGRETCPALGELLANWDGQFTEQTRDMVVWHIGECQTCAHHGWGAMGPATFSRLLPLAPLPVKLREQVLSLCTSSAEDAVAYRRRVARRAERIWLTRFSQAISWVSWDGIRANPGMVLAAVAVAVWVTAAVSVAMLTFAPGAQAARVGGARTAQARATQASAGTYSGSPAAVTVPASAVARPSPTVTRSSAYAPAPARSAPPTVTATSPATSRSASASASPQSSKSPRPSKSASPSPSPSRTTSPSSSPSSPSPTPGSGR